MRLGMGTSCSARTAGSPVSPVSSIACVTRPASARPPRSSSPSPAEFRLQQLGEGAPRLVVLRHESDTMAPVGEPWSHNIHYHPTILRAIPAGATRVLD